MKTVKVVFYWIVITAMLIVAAGCDEPVDMATQDTTYTSECKTITILLPADNTITGTPRDMKSINEMLEALNERTIQELNTKIEFIWPQHDEDNLEASSSGDYRQQLKDLLKSNDAPDAYCIHRLMINEFCKEGYLKDITDLIPSYLGGYFSMLLATWDEELDSVCKYDSKIYAIPCNDLNLNRYCVIAREDLVDKYMTYGINNLDDYCAFLEAVKENEFNHSSDIFAGWFSEPEVFFNAYISGNGYLEYYPYLPYIFFKYDAYGINPVYMHQTDVFQTACNLYKDIVENDMLFKGKGRGAENAMQEDKIASVLCKMSDMHIFCSALGLGDEQYRIYPLYLDSVYAKSVHTGYLLGINPNSENADTVLIFIAWLHSSQENYDLFMYGIKDKHYRIVNNHLELDNTQAISDYWRRIRVIFSNYLHERPYSFEPEDYVEFKKDCAFRNTVSFSLKEERLLEIFTKPKFALIMGVYHDFFKELDRGITDNMQLNQIIDEKGLQHDVDSILDLFKTVIVPME